MADDSFSKFTNAASSKLSEAAEKKIEAREYNYFWKRYDFSHGRSFT